MSEIVTRYQLANVYRNNKQIHELVPLSEAETFVQDKRNNCDNGIEYALDSIEARVYEVEVETVGYGTPTLKEDDFGERINSSSTTIRNPERFRNPAEGDTVHVAVCDKQSHGARKKTYPEWELPNELDL